MSQPRRLLFVCLGNICRSPLAEGIFGHLVDEAGLAEVYSIDSAGTSAYHAGDGADPRSIEIGRRNGVAVSSRSRKLRDEDFEEFDLLIAMDGENERNMLRVCPDEHRSKVRKMREWDPQGPGDVPDPYYGGPRGFDDNYAMLLRTCRALLEELEG